MKQFNHILISILLVVLSSAAQAQQWQWAKKAGSVVDVCDGCIGNNQEQVKSMYTDKDGNTYLFGVMGWQGKFDTFTPPPNIISGSNDQMYFLAKTSCSGTVEWVKYFGGGTASFIFMNDMLVDEAADRIYLSLFTDHKLIISNDTTYIISPGGDPTGLLIFNLNGQRQELKILSRATYELALRNMKMDANFNKYATMQTYSSTVAVFPGVFIDPGKIYIFKFDRDFNYISHFDMQIDSNSIIGGAQVNYQVIQDKYVGIYNIIDTATIGDSTINVRYPNSAAVFCSFDSNGTITGLTHSLPGSNPNLFVFFNADGKSGIKFVGDTLYSFTLALNARFNQDTFVSVIPSGLITGVTKFLLSNLNNSIAKRFGKSLRTIELGGGVAELTKDKYYMPIQVWDSCWYGTYKIKPNPFRVMDYIAVLDHNLNFVDTIKLNIEHSFTSSKCEITNMTTDKNDNLYIAGIYDSPFFLPFDTLNIIGGVKDIYFAKYGKASCTPCLPLAAWSDSSYNFTIYCSNQSEFADSVRWSFGDATSSSSFNATHTYSSSGVYTVCMYAFGSCGIDTVCRSIGITAISPTASELPILVYPNPANDHLTVQFSANHDALISIIDLQGKTMYQSKSLAANNQKLDIDISKLCSGLYSIIIKDGSAQGIKKLTVIR